MAICHVRLGEQDAALDEAAAALALDPRSADARILRGGILAGRGEYDAALRELRAAVESDPAKPMVRLDLAKVLDEAGRRSEARQEYESILAMQRDYAPALTGLGALEARDGHLQQAAVLLRRALQLEPAHASTRFDLARVLEQQGLRDEARAEYRTLADDKAASPAVRAAARQRLRTTRHNP
jgi:Flp pilus assembly protein TadD